MNPVRNSKAAILFDAVLKGWERNYSDGNYSHSHKSITPAILINKQWDAASLSMGRERNHVGFYVIVPFASNPPSVTTSLPSLGHARKSL